MFARTPPLILIAALIACPLLCSSGLVDCCAVVATPVSSLGLQSGTHCCCQHQHSTSGDHAPSKCPAQHGQPCQGICGGAVFAQSVEIDFSLEADFLPLPVTDSVTGIEQRHIFSFAPPRQRLAGRMLRTLYESFLC